MPKPFANSQPITPSLISGDWLLGIQTGNSTGDNGLPQMKYIKLSQLTDWVRSNFGEMWRYRGGFSASLPSDPQDGDYFLATATFTVGADTYTKDHLYAYNGSSWDDISDILTQYASQSQVTDIDDRLTVVEVKVDAMGDGVVYKGEVATYADLAGIVDPQTGWEYFVTANASFYIYNGSSWDQIDNGIVQTITDGDTAHAPSGDAVYDALAAEAAARTAADSNLKGAIDNNAQRIENLEVAVSGSLVQTNTDATMANTKTITNANEILPWAILKRVGARFTQFNQLNNTGTRTDITGQVIKVTYTSNQTKLEIVGTPTSNFDTMNNPHLYVEGLDPNHTYLLLGTEKGQNLTCATARRKADNTTQYGAYASIPKILTGIKSITVYCGITTSNVIGDYLEFNNGMVIDLTMMGLDTITQDQFRALFPASYYPYNAGEIIPLNPTGIKVVQKNKIDPSTLESGYYEDADFTIGSSLSTVYKSFKILLEAGTYTVSFSLAVNILRLVKDNVMTSNPVSNVTSYTFTCSTTGWVGLSFRDATSSSTDWSDSTTIQLEIGSSATAYEPYTETTIDTSFTSDYKYVNENCYDYSENVLVDGVMRRKDQTVVGSVDLGTLNYTKVENWGNNGVRLFYASFILATGRKGLCGIYNVTENGNNAGEKELLINSSFIGAGTIGITDSSYNSVGSADDPSTFLGHLQGKYLNYQLATIPDPTYADPIPNLPCEDGTTITAVTPQTDLVNAIDVPSTIAYMTKISS